MYSVKPSVWPFLSCSWFQWGSDRRPKLAAYLCLQWGLLNLGVRSEGRRWTSMYAEYQLIVHTGLESTSYIPNVSQPRASDAGLSRGW